MLWSSSREPTGPIFDGHPYKLLFHQSLAVWLGPGEEASHHCLVVAVECGSLRVRRESPTVAIGEDVLLFVEAAAWSCCSYDRYL